MSFMSVLLPGVRATVCLNLGVSTACHAHFIWGPKAWGRTWRHNVTPCVPRCVSTAYHGVSQRRTSTMNDLNVGVHACLAWTCVALQIFNQSTVPSRKPDYVLPNGYGRGSSFNISGQCVSCQTGTVVGLASLKWTMRGMPHVSPGLPDAGSLPTGLQQHGDELCTRLFFSCSGWL